MGIYPSYGINSSTKGINVDDLRVRNDQNKESFPTKMRKLCGGTKNRKFIPAASKINQDSFEYWS